jgi:hypothetical protein
MCLSIVCFVFLPCALSLSFYESVGSISADPFEITVGPFAGEILACFSYLFSSFTFVEKKLTRMKRVYRKRPHMPHLHFTRTIAYRAKKK